MIVPDFTLYVIQKVVLLNFGSRSTGFRMETEDRWGFRLR